MAKKVGRAFLLKISDGAGGFDPFTGLTAKSLTINNERIDVTTPDPTTPEGEMWTESLAGAKSVALSGDFTLVDDTAEARAVAQAVAAAGEDDFQIVVPDVGTWEGTFAIESLAFSGEAALTGSMSLASNGKPTFTAA